MTQQYDNLPNPLNELGRPDAEACRKILGNKATVEDAITTLSTSELIVVALAFGRDDLLPKPYSDFRSAWRRLDGRQRRLVDLAAKGRWQGQNEGAVC